MAPPPLSSPLLLILFSVATAIALLAFTPYTPNRRDCNLGGGRSSRRKSVSREFFPSDGDVVWVLQVSDLHLSAHYPERGESLRSRLASVVRVVRPALVFVTGDITDAKNKVRTSSRQDETEWMQYRNIIDDVAKECDINKTKFVDIRGNHDKYGVPFAGDKLDFFSTYSVSSQFNRLDAIQSISFVGNGWRYIFLAIDDTMKIGLRGPANLFGHPTDEMIEVVESELHYWDKDPHLLVTKIVFGHFPLSFVASSECGRHYETTFAEQSVSAYLCGHLHAKFSKQLWRKHTVELAFNSEGTKSKQFWEWELGDWKESRLMRILAIDKGMVSFLDIEHLGSSRHQDFETAILITYPLDSRNMNLIGSNEHISRNDISALVFSVKQILNVTAKVFDSSKDFSLIEEVPLKLSNTSASYVPLFTSQWNVEKYKGAQPTRYWLQVVVLDSHGQETASHVRPISIEGKPAHFQITWLAYLIFQVQWEKLLLILIWGITSFLAILLSIPKIFSFIKKDVLYRRWVIPIFNSLPVQCRKVIYSMLWFLMEGSRNRFMWCSMVIYVLCLLMFPWLWGHATSEKGEVAKMFMFGWTIESDGYPTKKEKLAFPDVMTIVIPFMYLVVTPLFLLIYSLQAETSSRYLHNDKKLQSINTHLSIKNNSEKKCQAFGILSRSTRGMMFFPCKLSSGGTRTVILLACVPILIIHIIQISAVMAAYGVIPVALSPVFCWIPPLLLATAIYMTRSPIG